MRRLPTLITALTFVTALPLFALLAAADPARAESPFRVSLDVWDCPSVLRPHPAFFGSIARILTRDGISREALKTAKSLAGAEGALLYTTKRGQRFILKKIKAETELSAYLIDRRLGLGLVPQVETITIDGKLYSAQKFVQSPALEAIDLKGKTRTIGNLAEIAANPWPDEMILFDALTGNIDRGGPEFTEKNFLILSDLKETPDLRNGPYVAPNARFIALDHGLAFTDFKLDRWASQYKVPGRIKPTDLSAILDRHPEFTRNLAEWSPDEIRRILGGKLDDYSLRPLLERREALLKLAGAL